MMPIIKVMKIKKTCLITLYLFFDISYSADYNNLPPTDVKNTFWYFKNRLVFKL